MTAKRPQGLPVRTLPATLADVALIDAPTCAAAGDMSVSWWHEEVRAGRAPAPVIRKPRFTRWRVSDVRAFWLEGVVRAVAAGEDSLDVRTQALKASARAKSKQSAVMADAGVVRGAGTSTCLAPSTIAAKAHQDKDGGLKPAALTGPDPGEQGVDGQNHE